MWASASQLVDEQPRDLSEAGKGASPAKLLEHAGDLSTCLSTSEAQTVSIPEVTMPKVTEAALGTKLGRKKREERRGACLVGVGICSALPHPCTHAI